MTSRAKTRLASLSEMAGSQVALPFARKINPDLQKERATATFNVGELTHIIDGGKEKTKRRKQIESILLCDSTFAQSEHCIARTDCLEESTRKGIRLWELSQQHDWDADELRVASRVINYESPFGVHSVMFIPIIERLGTDVQKAKWLPLAKNMKMIGTYAQTELGHGTYLSGLETTATYDATTEEFILNTPKLTAMKWWPGGLGKTSNFAVVMAQLLIGQNNYGNHGFLVKLRSTEDHKLMPGVQAGDIGSKFGINHTDNGFLILDHVRIPRNNMLMKYAHVSRDGTFTKVGAEKMSYGGMLYVRAMFLTDDAYAGLSLGATIAIRYSAVRRQGKINQSGQEVQVLDYQTQQYKLFPYLAAAYATLFIKKYFAEYYNTIYQEMQRGVFRLLPELHSQSSGLKALLTSIALEGCHVFRQSCGGHGYLWSSRLPDLISDFSLTVTVEGENTVLYLQTARFLMKSFAAAQTVQNLPQSVAYLCEDWSTYCCPLESRADCLNVQYIKGIYQNRVYNMIAKSASKLQYELENTTDQQVAWNKVTVQMVEAAKAHCHMVVVCNFLDQLQTLPVENGINNVMSTLSKFYALHMIVKHSGDFLMTGSVNLDQLELIRNQELDLLSAIRPNAVALVDAFDYHDQTLNSTLGSYDGQAYERLYQSTKTNPLNKTEVIPAYYKYIQPMQRKYKAKL